MGLPRDSRRRYNPLVNGYVATPQPRVSRKIIIQSTLCSRWNHAMNNLLMIVIQLESAKYSDILIVLRLNRLCLEIKVFIYPSRQLYIVQFDKNSSRAERTEPLRHEDVNRSTDKLRYMVAISPPRGERKGGYSASAIPFYMPNIL